LIPKGIAAGAHHRFSMGRLECTVIFLGLSNYTPHDKHQVSLKSRLILRTPNHLFPQVPFSLRNSPPQSLRYCSVTLQPHGILCAAGVPRHFLPPVPAGKPTPTAVSFSPPSSLLNKPGLVQSEGPEQGPCIATHVMYFENLQEASPRPTSSPASQNSLKLVAYGSLFQPPTSNSWSHPVVGLFLVILTTANPDHKSARPRVLLVAKPMGVPPGLTLHQPRRSPLNQVFLDLSFFSVRAGLAITHSRSKFFGFGNMIHSTAHVLP